LAKQKKEAEEQRQIERDIQRARDMQREFNAQQARTTEKDTMRNSAAPKDDGFTVQRKTRFFMTLQLGAMFGVGQVKLKSLNFYTSNRQKLFSFTGVVGGRVSRIAMIGFGMGVDVTKEGKYVPIFVHLHVALSKKQLTPFLRANVGYALGISKEKEGADWAGLMVAPSVGIKYILRKGVELNILEFGYRLQMLKYETLIFNGYSAQRQSGRLPAHFLTLRAGVTFP
jgi:hypothetical protein